MPTYRVAYRNGSVETIRANSESHAREIAGARLRVGLKRGFPDLSPASKRKLLGDANKETRAATVKEVAPGTAVTPFPQSNARPTPFRKES